MGKLTLILDSSQLSNYFMCNRMWDLGNRQRLIHIELANLEQTKTDSSKDMGTFGHKLMERYYSTYRFLYNQTDAIEYALAVNMDATHCACGDSVELHHSIDTIGAPTINEDHYCTRSGCKCTHFTPIKFPLDEKSRAKVRDKFVEYIYTWTGKGDFEIQTPEMVEVGFSECIYEDDERLFVLEGRMDIAQCVYNGSTCAVDHKFQTKRSNLYRKKIQFRNYDLVGRQGFFIINYIRMAKEANQETFKRDIASFSAPERIWWKQQLIRTYHRIADDIQYGRLAMPNWSNCDTGTGYRQCQFTPICEEEYLGSGMMKNRIDMLYTQAEAWRPW